MSRLLLAPSAERTQASALQRFIDSARARHAAPVGSWEAFHDWSVRELDSFWRLVLEDSGALWSGRPEPALTSRELRGARFFPDVALSYAENLLRFDPDEVAIRAADETGFEAEITRGELARRVRRAAGALQALGIGPGDRVAAVAGNRIETVVACLAATALGATWSACGPDMGAIAMRERFAQVEPRLLLWHPRHSYQGVVSDLEPRVTELLAHLPSVRTVVSLGERRPLAERGHARLEQATLDELVERGPELAAFARLPFDHPLFVLFSSGTTGAPKCIVHGTGGTLLTHLKEHRLHCDLGPGDRLYFQTSCAWMMWNWLVSALASGASIVLYDGSPAWPSPSAPWKLIERFRVTAFGTSPAFVSICRGLKLVPKDKGDLSSLRLILSTGSVLSDAEFDWLARSARPGVPIASISGGTDLIGCFLLGNPLLPVHAGELQSKSLGMDVRCHEPDAHGVGELVCKAPFPSRPVAFLNDPDGKKYEAAYYAQNPGCWTHGDLLEVTPTGFRIHGRSDGVMNILGVRIGPGEIYRALEGTAEVKDALACEMTIREQSQLVLLVVLADGITLDLALASRIKKTLKERCSPTHVPTRVAAVSGLPYTHSGKKSERAVRDVLAGRAAVNRAALRNPETLDEIKKALGA